ncbi:hypothetical protein, partial [Gordonia paraffinivorans]|uniref:hypothetical protein n=1 Tax=Gordonia paraffinivorans TaxID=175628 RepID=UPI0011B1F940
RRENTVRLLPAREHRPASAGTSTPSGFAERRRPSPLPLDPYHEHELLSTARMPMRLHTHQLFGFLSAIIAATIIVTSCSAPD